MPCSGIPNISPAPGSPDGKHGRGIIVPVIYGNVYKLKNVIVA
jgi:hypothetical protein